MTEHHSHSAAAKPTMDSRTGAIHAKETQYFLFFSLGTMKNQHQIFPKLSGQADHIKIKHFVLFFFSSSLEHNLPQNPTNGWT